MSIVEKSSTLKRFCKRIVKRINLKIIDTCRECTQVNRCLRRTDFLTIQNTSFRVNFQDKRNLNILTHWRFYLYIQTARVSDVYFITNIGNRLIQNKIVRFTYRETLFTRAGFSGNGSDIAFNIKEITVAFLKFIIINH